MINQDRELEMEKIPFGYWHTEAADVCEGDLYQFLLDGEILRADPASLSQPQGVHGPSQVVSRTSFHWSDDRWKGLPLKDMIIYELHVGTFADNASFTGVADRLDYLVDLGINTIELMPISQFPGGRNWGYDGVYPFATQNTYGGSEGLKKLVDACHSKGIAVVLDVVYNHMGPEGNYLNDFGPYFTDKYSTPWGKAINFDDAYSDPVRSFFMQNALMWLDEYHIDGLRLDAIHAIKDLGANHFLKELSGKVRSLEEQKGRNIPLIGECDLNDTKFIKPATDGGYGLDGQWIDEFHHAIHALLTKENTGYYEDFGTFEHLFKAFSDTYVYDGTYSSHRHKVFGNSALDRPYSQFVVFSQNHDQVGNRMMGDRLTSLLTYDQLKLCAVAVLLSPYVPMLFMGEEYAETKDFQYFVSHTDKGLVEAVRQGRKSEFAYFQKEGLETPDPQSEQTFKNSTLSWNMQEEKRATMLKLYQKLIKLRKELPALQSSERNLTVFNKNDNYIIAMKRISRDGGKAHIIMNFGNQKASYQLPQDDENVFKCLLDTSQDSWLGKNNNERTAMKGEDQLDIAAYSAVILSN